MGHRGGPLLALFVICALAIWPIAGLSAATCADDLNEVFTEPTTYSFDAIDAISADDVWATGESERTYFAHWDGESWADVLGPEPERGQYDLKAISGATANDVWAVGAISSSRRMAALHWDGHGWSATAVPRIGRDAILYDIQAFPDGTAYSVGAFKPNQRKGIRPLVLYFDGTQWSREEMGLGGSRDPLFDISAVSRDSTWAVPGRGSFVLHRDPHGWSRFPLPDGLREPFLRDVAVTPEGDAWFVGHSGRNEKPLVLRWDGAEWIRFSVPDRRYEEYLFAVDASSAEDVWVAGMRITGDTAYPYAALFTEDGFHYVRADNPGWMAFWAISVDETGGVWAAGESGEGIIQRAC